MGDGTREGVRRALRDDVVGNVMTTANHRTIRVRTRVVIEIKRAVPKQARVKHQKTCRPAKDKRRSPPINLKDYNGYTSIETFFQQFWTCAAYYHWTEDDKGVYLRFQLTGDAANLL